jgi:multidrug transporter EmrE-like cation transporter
MVRRDLVILADYPIHEAQSRKAVCLTHIFHSGDQEIADLAHHFQRSYEVEDVGGVMNGETFSLIMFNVVLTAAGQVSLKAGMMSGSIQSALTREGWMAVGVAATCQPMILAGLAAYGVSLLVWLVVLARVPVSSAYPFVALSIALTSVGGALLFGETFSLSKLTGTILILAGVVAISRG